MPKTVCLLAGRPAPCRQAGAGRGRQVENSGAALFYLLVGEEEQEMFFILFILFGDNGDVGEDKEELCP